MKPKWKDDVGYWEIVIPPELVDSLRKDPKFHAIQNLSRIANTIRFTQVALTQHMMSDMPAAKRQRFSSFFYASALLFEALIVAESLGKYFKDLPEYKNGIGRIMSSPLTTKLRSGALKTVRKKLVFHLDEDVAQEGLGSLNVDKWVVASGFGPQIQNSYFDLADVMLIQYLTGNKASKEEFIPVWTELLKEVTALLLDFVESSEKLIPRVLMNLGARIEYPPAPKS